MSNKIKANNPQTYQLKLDIVYISKNISDFLGNTSMKQFNNINLKSSFLWKGLG